MAHPARRRLTVPLLALGMAATLAPAITASPASAAPAARPAPASAYGQVPVGAAASLAPYARQRLTWKRCAADKPAAYRCATLKVPLDYRAPRGRTIDVAISRLRTSEPGKRRGVLTFNPGGPGGAGLDLALEAADALPKRVLDQYDLVGFDPRGVGRSTPVACGLTEEEKRFPRPTRSKAEFAANVAWAKGVAGKCRARHGDLLPHLTTRNTARDMDVLRAALGEKKLSYLGVSYGTALGAVYTQLFPKRVDRFVLDSAIDPAWMWRDMFRVWGSEAEPAFRRWARWTARHDAAYHLGATPAQVERTFWRLVRRADAKPLVVGGETLDGAAVRHTMRRGFFTVRQGAETLVTLKRAAAGETVPGLPTGTTPDNEMSAQWVVVCADASWPRDVRTYYRDSLADAARYPLYGDFASSIPPCAFWPRGAEPVTEVDNKVPALIVQNEWDSQSPLLTARGMHRALKGSRMVTVDEGEGHGVLFAEPRSACAEDTALDYLATGRLPARDVTCRAAPGRSPRPTGAAPNAFRPAAP
ncbi:alpha/beta hydrolase [Streptomyces longispororuber]